MKSDQSDVFTETWLHQDLLDDKVSISGLQTQSDLKEGGGRLAVLVKNRSCDPGHIIIKERLLPEF